jgi:hypothetical protein
MKDLVLEEKLTGFQRSAIQILIQAKSDREIARLSRQSHRLLNLHRRRRSTISHRERSHAGCSHVQFA